MKGRLAIWGALFALSSVVAQPALAASSGAIVRSVDAGDFPRVQLRVEVVDAEGRYVVGLPEDAFSVTENGVEMSGVRTATYFAGEQQAVSVVLAIDVSGSMQGQPIARAKAAAKTFLNNVGELDEVQVVAFGDSVTKIAGSGDASPDKDISKLEADDGTTHLYDGILTAARLAGDKSATRTAVIVLTDGHDEGSKANLQKVQSSLPSDVSVHAVALESSRYDPAPLRAIADGSSGMFVEATPSQLAGVYERLAKNLRSNYLVSYKAPAEPLSERSVVVIIGSPGGKLTAEATYLPPGASEESSRTWAWVMALVGLGLALLLTVVFLLLRRGEGPGRSRSPWLGPAFVVGEHRFPITKEVVTVGRESGVDVLLKEPTVSRVHARLWRGEDGLLVEDLESANGTFINGVQISSQLVHDGDSVRFGDAELRYEERLS